MKFGTIGVAAMLLVIGLMSAMPMVSAEETTSTITIKQITVLVKNGDAVETLRSITVLHKESGSETWEYGHNGASYSSTDYTILIVGYREDRYYDPGMYSGSHSWNAAWVGSGTRLVSTNGLNVVALSDLIADMVDWQLKYADGDSFELVGYRAADGAEINILVG